MPRGRRPCGPRSRPGRLRRGGGVRRFVAARDSRSATGPNRPRFERSTTSAAPALSISTAASSPIVPDSRISGTSAPRASMTASASRALSCSGRVVEEDQVPALPGQLRPRTARRSPPAGPSTSSPPRPNSCSTSALSSSWSSTSSTFSRRAVSSICPPGSGGPGGVALRWVRGCGPSSSRRRGVDGAHVSDHRPRLQAPWRRRDADRTVRPEAAIRGGDPSTQRRRRARKSNSSVPVSSPHSRLTPTPTREIDSGVAHG